MSDGLSEIALEESAVIKRVSRKRHRCSPPGFWKRLRLDLDFGSVWECGCGQRWEWQFTYADESWKRV